MSAEQTETTPPPTVDLLFAGVLPPPVHGASVANQALADFLYQAGHRLERQRTTTGGEGWKGRIAGRLAASSQLAFKLSRNFLQRREINAVISLSGGSGLLFDVLNVLLLRVLRKNPRLAFAHHNYTYCRRFSLVMAVLVKLSPGATHIFLSPRMRVSFEAMYGAVADARILGNSWLVPSPPRPAEVDRSGRAPSSIVIGHLSNLSFEKGLREVGDVFRRLASMSIPSRLTLAGPARGEELDYIKALLEEFPGVVEWRGALYAESKQEWFKSIDVFLFPSKYANEAYPIVLSEAMAVGAVPIATDIGCIPEILSGALADCCISAPFFVDRSTTLLADMASNPALKAERSSLARQRFAELQTLDNSALLAVSEWASRCRLA